MKRIWKSSLVFMLVVAMSINMVNVPVYAQESVKEEVIEVLTGDTISDNLAEEQFMSEETISDNEIEVCATEMVEHGII